MKTINEQQAVEQFDEYSELAHNGEKILVTRGGKPWVLLTPPAAPHKAEPANGKLKWPDFAARLTPHYPTPVAGPTATDLLSSPRTRKTAFEGLLRQRIAVQALLAGSQHACRPSHCPEIAPAHSAVALQ